MSSGEFVRENEVKDVVSYMRFASQQLGVGYPIGVKGRGIAIRRIKEEMEIQRWDFKHLVAAIKYMKARGIKARTLDYVFYHVKDAIEQGFLPRPPISTHEDLKLRIAAAVQVEQDDQWVRKLLMARGDNMRLVYESWEKERAV